MDLDYEDEKRGYSWEAEYKRSWDVLKEDETGLNIKSISRKTLRNDKPIQRGILRQVCVIVDASSAMGEQDLPPNRLDFVFQHLKRFFVEFADQNPLSHISLVGLRDGLAERWSEWSGNPVQLIKDLESQKRSSGEASLENGLSLCHQMLKYAANHISKEIIVIFGSLSSTDPGNIMTTIDDLKRDKIKVNVVGLTASVRVLDHCAKTTNGKYSVIMNEHHFRDLLYENIPPSGLETVQASLIQMGFPKSKRFEIPTLCACHQEPKTKGHICPRCKATVCNIPTDCPVCALVLVSSPSLARTFPYLFPVPTWNVSFMFAIDFQIT
ncbi:Ssl1-like-domain-containing protein [Gorgonomyces haynaldii]|nr:Ssl1-like-domain-containing protein [Gorgonomyces haynaldii]